MPKSKNLRISRKLVPVQRAEDLKSIQELCKKMDGIVTGEAALFIFHIDEEDGFVLTGDVPDPWLLVMNECNQALMEGCTEVLFFLKIPA